MFGIFHAYDVDGGFGDAIERTELLFAVETEEEAKAYVERWSQPHVYDKLYAELVCGYLYYNEITVFTPDENYILKSPYELVKTNCNPDIYEEEDDWKDQGEKKEE